MRIKLNSVETLPEERREEHQVMVMNPTKSSSGLITSITLSAKILLAKKGYVCLQETILLNKSNYCLQLFMLMEIQSKGIQMAIIAQGFFFSKKDGCSNGDSDAPSSGCCKKKFRAGGHSALMSIHYVP
ncbi:uncharacterized protein [Euphorbia lathyris]|uniref:uncharacterized protein n=1 Tax=Euphorbia lathyris TaxID=212925 RepID=UPI00331423F5